MQPEEAHPTSAPAHSSRVAHTAHLPHLPPSLMCRVLPLPRVSLHMDGHMDGYTDLK